MTTTSSPARIAANRANSLLSTGPKTPEGKAASRANSFKHGMTGDGIVVPSEDLARIAAIAEEFRQKHRPTTLAGLALADRAAILTVRLDRCGMHEIAIVEDQVFQALHEFDQFRLDRAEELFDSLREDPAAIEELMGFTEGVDRLIAEWRSLEAIEEWSPEDLERIAILTDAKVEEAAGLAHSIPELIARLEAARDAIDPRPRAIARERAKNRARFSASPEAILARRYDAVTDRALEKAKKALEEACSLDDEAIPTAETPQTPVEVEAMASITPRPSPPTAPVVPAPPTVAPVDPESQAARARRPDPKKLRASQKKKRR